MTSAPGDDDALALAARQLVRVAAGEVGRRAQPGRLERRDDLGVALGSAVADAVDGERLGHEVEDRLLRVQRLVRVLEDELDPPPVVPQRSRCPTASLTSWPSNGRVPPVWRVSLTMTRPVVVLPLPDSPTSARTSPRRSVRSMPSTARTTPARAPPERVEDPAADREVDLEALELDQRSSGLDAGALARRRARRPPSRRSGRSGRPRPRLGAGVERPSADEPSGGTVIGTPSLPSG